MSERKNIEKIFQEKFTDFEVTPEEFIWENIESKLNKKKEKRRVVPFWWTLSGVAAALLIGFFSFINNDSPVKTEESVVVKEVISEKNNSEKTSITTNQAKQNEVVATSETTNKIKNNNSSTAVNTLMFTKNKGSKSTIKTPFNLSNTKQNIAVHKTTKRTLLVKNKLAEPELNVPIQREKSEIALVEKQNTESTSNQINNKAVINNNSNEITLNNNTTEIVKTKIDSIVVASIEPNALEELQKEKEKKTSTEQKLNRWQVSSNVAPIYFSSTSNGSPLDERLKNNDKNYATSYSYGLGVNYAINKKLNIKSGVNVLNVNYDTYGIAYYQSQSVNSKIANLNPNLPGSLIVIESLNNVNSTYNKFIQKYEGSLNQKMGYIEVPLEINYKILDKKLGIDIVGGMSTMILNQNEIYLQSTDLNLKVGEASNLNTIHFSGNLGLGFKYALFKHVAARIEPVFKYQINTFSKDAGDFKPYVFGVYSGINYTF